MTKEIERLYRRFRKDSPFMLVGKNAQLALDSAKTLLAFQELESAGLARIISESDESPDASFYDTWEHLSERSKEELKQKYYDDCVGVIGQYRQSEDDEWEDLDSIWGCSGYTDPCSPFENCYVIDIMDATVERAKTDISNVAILI
jgi:hypothetical protein